MDNNVIARQFNLLASLMELHGENAFKTKAYANAYLTLRKLDHSLATMSAEELAKVPGLGSSVITKIRELLETGKIDALEKLKAITPEGIQHMLTIKGLGPKKIRVIWDDLKVESPAELLYACNENRLVALKGFGIKTQEDLIQKITYFMDSQDKYLYGIVERDMESFLEKLTKAFPKHRIEWVGEFATKSPIINRLNCLVSPKIKEEDLDRVDGIVVIQYIESHADIRYDDRFAIEVNFCEPGDFLANWTQLTSDPSLFEKLRDKNVFSSGSDLPIVLKKSGFEALPVELLDKPGIADADYAFWKDLVELQDLKGIIHNHSTWSDGIHTLVEMAVHVKEQGFEYFAICDHSRSAFYANGLSAERVLEQIEEIDRLNKRLAPFRIFKGIESDILGDGSLDYEDDILSRFELVVASVHSNLRMDEPKAMSRLIKAVENPFTRILGHPTGRLLLARQGYPVNHKKLIDACAANGVAIELNANPLRLDIDYAWLAYCMEKEVLVSINPDAHSRSQVDYIRFGVNAARKGGLKKSSCLNALSLEAFERWLKKS